MARRNATNALPAEVLSRNGRTVVSRAADDVARRLSAEVTGREWRGDRTGDQGAGTVWFVGWDDDGLDEEPSSPLLPPEDRLWRHPSEVAVGVTAQPGGPEPRRVSERAPPRVVTIVALTSCISVLFTLGVIAVVRPFRDGADTRAPDARAAAAGLMSVTDVADVAARLRPTIARVVAKDAEGGETWGSGVIFREDGMLLTTERVVDGASSFAVFLDDGRAVAARLVGADDETNVAVLDVQGDGFPTAPLAEDRTTARVGQPGITIGATPGGPLVRMTVVTAIGQEATIGGRKFLDMIRTDTAIDPGMDGGAVTDAGGRVIGIAAVNTPAVDDLGSLAIPSDLARTVATQLMTGGRVRRSWLGIEGRSATAGDGVVVDIVRPEGPAAVGGIAAGDVIVSVGSFEVKTMSDLVKKLRKSPPNSETVLVVERGGARHTIRVTLRERPA